jgi:hypothetical protein
MRAILSCSLPQTIWELQGRRGSVLVNNRSEGPAPLTVQALSDQMGADTLER